MSAHQEDSNSMATDPTSTRGQSFRAERTGDEVVLRFPSLNRLMRAFLPEDARKHLYAAQREQLLAMRSMLDAAIKRIESAEKEEQLGPRRTEITVE
jgi:hypothetical protein